MKLNRSQALLEQMSLEEKIGQLMQLSADFFDRGTAVITGPMQEKDISLETVYRAGSVLGVSGSKNVKKIQNDFLTHSRLKIPLLFMGDIVHGFETTFPIPLALSSSFDPEIMMAASQIAAKESAAAGLHVTFAPMVDLVRDPRWGRVMESTGEDPYLNSVMATASVEGFQGGSRIDSNHIAACVKHFAAYGAPEAGREYNTVDISEWRFREQYLPAYAAAVQAQSKLVMTSFNTLFGVPATGNQYLMRDILRDELAFKGVVISDWDAIAELIKHGVAGNLRSAADKALKAGVDIDMMSFAYSEYLKKAAPIDQNIAKLIDESVLRILNLKDELGLFDDPFRGITEEREQRDIFSKENLNIAQQAAEDSIVLLKNKNHLLPLAVDEKIALVGPVADSGDLLGSWSWKGDISKTQTIAVAMQEKFTDVLVAKGSDYHAINVKELEKAMTTAHEQETVIVCLGLPASESGEATSLTDIKIPEEQLQLLRKLATLNKKVISVIVTGRPMDLTEVSLLSDAIVLAWFPGSRGAQAIKNIISGEINPNAKLPMTFPRSVGQVPIYYNYYNTGRPITNTNDDFENKYQSKYIDSSNSPLYPFGFGLSYSTFKIKKVSLNADTFDKKTPPVIAVEIENLSDYSGKTTIQCYSHQTVSETVQPLKKLICFKKVTVAAHATETIQLSLDSQQFTTVHQDMKRSIDPGSYELMIGLDSETASENKLRVSYTGK